MPRFVRPLLGIAAALACGAASALDVTVLAKENCVCDSIGGAAAVELQAGQSFTVTASVNDLWSAGDLPRMSDANGLIGERFATADDDSGLAVGTHIGTDKGTFDNGTLNAAYGALVGKIGNGDYFLIGTSYSGTASTSGLLSLYFWDTNGGDNSGSILASVNVTAVPEPGTYGLMAGGLGVLAWVARRRRA